MKKETGGVIINPSCENHCVFCRRVPKASRTELEKQEINVFKCLLEFKQKGLGRLEISGADPIEYGGILRLIKYAKNIGFGFVQLSSHGNKLGEEDFLKKLIKTGVDKLRVPVYGSNKEIHDLITRRKGSFDSVLKGLRTIKKLAPAIEIQVSNLIMEQNKNDLADWLRLMDELAIVDYYLSIPFRKKVEGNNHEYYIPIKDLPPYVKKAAEYSRKHGKTVRFMEIPFCVFGEIKNNIINNCLPPDHGKYCQPERKLKTKIKDLPIYRLKSKAAICKKCKADSFCDGFAKSDLEEFGTGKLKAILK
ncbi:MAG: radical SAM protein [Candidatus Portnoybacteria bacterium]|nr:radical SAM protein [Candidatus Portnoybacteria bacterium]MDD4982853.1 radical SAM protein [Candidatus Portnoybacteria bacterium]